MGQQLYNKWVDRPLQSNNQAVLFNWEKEVQQAKLNRPTDEHFIPLFFAWGAGQKAQGRRSKAKLEYDEYALGSLGMHLYWFS